MAEQEGEDINQASIKPVSSLRSLFENKGESSGPLPRSRPISRPPAGGQSSSSRGIDDPPATRASLDVPSSNTSSWATTPQRTRSREPNTLSADAFQRAETWKLQPVAARPPSPPNSPSQSPPVVTVDSPHSPAKQREPPPRTPLSGRPSFDDFSIVQPSRSTSPLGGLRSFRIPSRSTTPASQVRNQSMPGSQIPDQSFTNSQRAARAQGHSPVPPPVNRAAKPSNLASKPTAPAERKASDSLAPQAAGNNEDDRASPFSTPPSESESLPSPEHAKPKAGPNRQIRDSYFARRPRHPERDTSEPPSSNHLQGTRAIPGGRPASNRLQYDDDSPEERPALPVRRDLTTAPIVLPGRIRGRSPRPPPPAEPPVRKSMESHSTAGYRPSFETPGRASIDGGSSARTIVAEAHNRFHPPPRRTKLAHSEDVPPPMPARPSLDAKREVPPPIRNGPPARVAQSHDSEDDDLDIVAEKGVATPADYPDSSQANRRPPRFREMPHDIPTKYETKLLALCGEFVCTAGYLTRVWSLLTGELLMSISHGETNKATAVAFRPAKEMEDEGKRLWLGMNTGELHEIDIQTQSVANTKANAHQRVPVTKILRHASTLWTIDEDGKWLIWTPDVDGEPSLDVTPHVCRVPRGATLTLLVGNQLWLAYGKDILIFQHDSGRTATQVLQKPLAQDGVGEVTSGTAMSSQPDRVYFGHIDGKVTIYSRQDYSCIGVINVSLYKISSLAGAGDHLWAGFNTGMIYVYDTTTKPWRVKKDWKAHHNTIAGIIVDRTSIWKLDRLQVASLGTDSLIRVWDGMLEEDWLELNMQEHDTEYCNFSEITALVMTWNAGASKPTALRHNQQDDNFFRELLSSYKAPPDILVFGFQELVDLEDKAVTARSLFKSSRKKEHVDHERMSHQYRAWRDYLVRCVEETMVAKETYHLLHTANLVGLFTCVFVKSSVRPRIRDVSAAEVKLGMGGLHGNKGALIVRFILDDSSLCFLNCHLAAGQRQTVHRNNDIAAIMESESLPPQHDSMARSVIFVGGGDGSMVLDHEICILNGDLNYRIDAIPRDTVIAAINEGNLNKLLERDQLLVSRRKNPGFRLRAFNENPITFAPTYKYDVGTDVYDSSEKKRSPAWCDRLLYRGVGRIKQLDYRRHDLRVSDHRPVSGYFKMRVKTIDAKRREKTRLQCERRFAEVKERIAWDIKLDYLVNVFGLSRKEAERLLKG